MKTAKEDKRKQILAAAVKVFSQKGYHKTRMEEIAMEAGIGKGTIYEYFASKIQLFQAMIEQGFDTYIEKINVEKAQNLPLSEWLQVLTEAHMHFCLEHKELTQIMFLERATPDEELMQWVLDNRAAKLNAMQEMLRKAMEKQEIRSFNPQLLLYIIHASMMSFYIPVVMEGWEIEPKYFAQQYVDILMNGIAQK